MAKWRTETALYEIHEISKKAHEVWHMKATGDEISALCKTKNEMNGYIDGVGGDRSYSCWAVVMTY